MFRPLRRTIGPEITYVYLVYGWMYPLEALWETVGLGWGDIRTRQPKGQCFLVKGTRGGGGGDTLFGVFSLVFRCTRSIQPAYGQLVVRIPRRVFWLWTHTSVYICLGTHSSQSLRLTSHGDLGGRVKPPTTSLTPHNSAAPKRARGQIMINKHNVLTNATRVRSVMHGRCSLGALVVIPLHPNH